MKFGLDDSVIEKLTEVFEANPKVDKAYVFGSRAKGNFRADSDIDIAIKGYDLTLDDILKMSVAFEDEGITPKIDLLDYNEIKEPALIEHIDRVGVESYSRWKEYEISDISDVTTGFAFPGEKYSSSGSLRVVRGENVTEGVLRWDSEKHWNYPTTDLTKYFLKEQDIVIGMDGSKVGQNRAIIRMNDLPLILAQRVACLRAKNEFDQKYLWYNIDSKKFTDYVESISTGTSIPHISQSQIGAFKLLAPPKSEQQIITSIITSLDDKIYLLSSQNKTLEQLAKTLFRQWFVAEAEENWNVTKISDVANINLRAISKNYPFKEIDYLDTGSITNGIIEGYQTFDLKHAPSRAQRIIQDDDIVYSLVRPIQRHFGFLHNVKPNAVASTGFCVVTSKGINPYFLYLFLTTKEAVEYLDMVAEGSTSAYPSLKPSDIANLEFLEPPAKKLEEFSKISLGTWSKIKSNQNQIQSLTKMRDTLLPKLMSGEVRVKMPE